MRKQKILDGKRIRTKYRGSNIYLMPMYDDDGFLVSFDFSQSGRADDRDGHKTTAGLELVSGLIYELLKCDRGQEKLMEVCHRTSFGKSDLPGIIYNVLKDLTGCYRNSHEGAK